MFENNIIKLRGYIVGNPICDKENFKIYPFIPTADYIDRVILNTYNNINIVGDIPELFQNTEYIAELEYSKKGNYENYIVHKIFIPKPNNEESSRKFLSAILNSPNQVNTLMSVYPDIIDRIINNKEVDLSLTKGIKDATFNKIKNKVIENFCLVDLVDEFADYEMSINMLKKLYNSYTSVEKIREAMKKSPYKCLCKMNGVSFKTADKKIIRKFPHMVNSQQRMLACIEYLLNDNEQKGNTWIHLKELQKKCEELALESMQYFIGVISKDEEIYFDKETLKIANKRAYNSEKVISDILKKLNKKDILDIDYTKYNNVDGFKLSDSQMNTLKNFCQYNLTLLQGWGGTGKSFSTKALINLMDDNNISYILLSPTGKASKVLADYTDRPASTIHRGLEYNPKKGFTYNSQNKLPYDVVIVDEFSMVDIYLMKSLLLAIDTENTRVLFIQDPSQIPSVQAGNVSFDMIDSKIIPTTTLTEVFRYGEGGLATIATKTRNGEKFIEDDFTGIKNFGLKKDFTFISVQQEASLGYLTKIYEKIYNKIQNAEDIMVLSAYNVGQYGTININNKIQELINPKDKDKKELSYKHDGEIITFREGDKVIQTKNNYKIKDEDGEESVVFNGNTGMIEKIQNNTMYVNFDGEVLKYEKGDIDNLMLGYAISIHKSQGSQSKYVIILAPKAHKFFLNRNLLYVGETRGKSNVYLISSPDVISSALKKEETFMRDTFLKELLII